MVKAVIGAAVFIAVTIVAAFARVNDPDGVSAQGTTVGRRPSPSASVPLSSNRPPTKTNVIREIVVSGNRHLTTGAIVQMCGHKPGDSADAKTLGDIRTRLVLSGYFGTHFPNDPAQWVTVTRERVAHGGWRVRITVDENDLLEVIKVDWPEPLHVIDVARCFHIGEVINLHQCRKDADTARSLYVKKGYDLDVPPVIYRATMPGVIEVDLHVERVANVHIGRQARYDAIEELVRAVSAAYGRDYFYPRECEMDIAKLKRSLPFDDVKATVHRIGHGQVDLDIQVRNRSIEEYLLVNMALDALMKERPNDKLALDRNGFEGLKPISPRIVIVDMERIKEEIEQARRLGGDSYSSESEALETALSRAVPGCRTYVYAEHPMRRQDGQIIVRLHVGPENDRHGTLELTHKYAFSRPYGTWTVREEAPTNSRWFQRGQL